MAKETANERFTRRAEAVGIEPDIQRFPKDTRTAPQAAAAIGCDVAQIVKSLVFDVDGAPVLVLTSGANRVSTAKVGQIFEGRVGRADADAVREATGFSIGGVPPFGHSTQLPTAVDQDLMGHEVIYGAAGTPDTVFPISPTRLVEATDGNVADVAEE
ncbi:MAG: YbaK/EbsC family protein [Actinomycetota bacterium]|nr:YbaK/EbsC family protein [Actinomycetota bacterium]